MTPCAQGTPSARVCVTSAQPAFPRPIAAVFAAKLSVLVYAVAVAFIVIGKPLTSPYDVLALWRHWDAAEYLRIAQQGYSGSPADHGLAFYPLFPALVSVLARVIGDVLVSGFVLVTAASVVATLALHRLARLDEDEASARAAVVVLLLFPTSFVLHIPYSESVFLALVLVSFLLARRERWLGASVLAAAAALTRVNGLLMLPALAAEAYAEYRRTGHFRRAWASIVLVPLGTLAYLATNFLVAGDAFRFAELLRRDWEKAPEWPWVGFARLASWSAQPSSAQPIWMVELLFVLIALAASVAVARALRPSYAVWTGLNAALFISTTTPLSVPRYSLVLFPLFILLGRIVAADRRWLALGIPSIALSCFLIGRFVMEQWAF